MFPNLVALVARAGLDRLDVLLCDILGSLRLRQRHAPSPPNPRGGRRASGAGSEEEPNGPIRVATLTLRSPRKSTPFCARIDFCPRRHSVLFKREPSAVHRRGSQQAPIAFRSRLSHPAARFEDQSAFASLSPRSRHSEWRSRPFPALQDRACERARSARKRASAPKPSTPKSAQVSAERRPITVVFRDLVSASCWDYYLRNWAAGLSGGSDGCWPLLRRARRPTRSRETGEARFEWRGARSDQFVHARWGIRRQFGGRDLPWGLNETEARRQGVAVRVAKLPIAGPSEGSCRHKEQDAHGAEPDEGLNDQSDDHGPPRARPIGLYFCFYLTPLGG
jgi:hypothetical protein